MENWHLPLQAEVGWVLVPLCVKLLSVWVSSSLTTIKTPTVIALGNFDGVHRGHQQVIRPIVSGESSARVPTDPPTLATVVTFNPHPQVFFSGQIRSLLTPIPEKVEVLKALGVEQLVLIPFDQAIAQLSPTEFIERILIERLQTRHISVGVDFRFGRQRQGSTADLVAIAAAYGVGVTTVPLLQESHQRISSSAIRAALTAGEIATANRLLGRPYRLHGTVVTGQQVGRTIGFPTANLRVPEDKFLPRDGVYSVRVWSETAAPPATAAWPGVMNIGVRPTVAGRQRTIEVHLLDWTGDLYGAALTVELHHFVRSEQKFDSLAALKAQICRDCHQARIQLAVSDPAQPG